MIEKAVVNKGKRDVERLEYRLHAFTSSKGTFTLIGTNHDWIDTFKNLDTGEFHDWPRSSIKKWLDQGKITPAPESTTLVWYQNQRRCI